MRRRLTIFLVAALLIAYLGSYLVLSRRAFAEADSQYIKGFYFFPPRESDSWQFCNRACFWLYYPLIVVDNSVGTGRWPGADPMFGLSR